MSLLETFSGWGCLLSSSELRNFGPKLHALRIRNGMTLKAVAGDLGMCTHSYLSELERGKKVPTALIVLRAARLFGVSTDVLMRDDMDLDAKDAPS